MAGDQTMRGARIFITGSADGLGRLAAQRLVGQNHQVMLHARDERRAREALASVPGAEDVLVADLSRLEEVARLAADANANGRFDAVIHNAGVYRASSADILAVNVLAPYVLTCLMREPERLIYLGWGEHWQGDPTPQRVITAKGSIDYADSKLFVLLLAKAVARKWPDAYVNVVDPGWVPTKMGGPNAPDDLGKGVETQAWLAVSTDREAQVSGRYFHHGKEAEYRAAADDASVQDELIAACARLTGVAPPSSMQVS
jgi:NAD(P)-dependent dehydrogenase (short-subunit alcohol dehydrogenase family)